MRKAVFALSLFLLLANGTNVRASDFGEKLALYIPSRFLDLADMFSFCLGYGQKIKAEGRITRWVSFGGGVGSSADVVKGYNRQYGFAMEKGWDASSFWLAAEDSEISKCSHGVQKYWYSHSGIPSCEEEIYNFYTGARDFWEIGGELTLLINIRGAMHPVEIADFITGIVFVDLKGDDLTFENFEN